MPMLSVKTARPIPKDKISDVITALHPITMNAPVNIGDIVAQNIAGTGVDIIATRSIMVK
jgi:CxxC motif-containing protein